MSYAHTRTLFAHHASCFLRRHSHSVLGHLTLYSPLRASKGKRLVNWLVCYDGVARDKALITGERLRAGKMFTAKEGGDVVLLDSDDVCV